MSRGLAATLLGGRSGRCGTQLGGGNIGKDFLLRQVCAGTFLGVVSSKLGLEDFAIALLGLLGHARVVDGRLEAALAVSGIHLG